MANQKQMGMQENAQATEFIDGQPNRVDEASEQSFPASDPPAHGTGERAIDPVVRSVGARSASSQQPAESKASVEMERADRTKQRLLRSLSLELFQTETSTRLHCQGEAQRLGNAMPASILRQIATHAEKMLKSLPGQMSKDQPINVAGAFTGTLFAVLREAIFDRLVSSERSYRSTLLELRHGIGLVAMLKELASRQRDSALENWCETWLGTRVALVQEAESNVSWFADHLEDAGRLARPLVSSEMFAAPRALLKWVDAAFQRN